MNSHIRMVAAHGVAEKPNRTEPQRSGTGVRNINSKVGEGKPRKLGVVAGYDYKAEFHIKYWYKWPSLYVFSSSPCELMSSSLHLFLFPCLSAVQFWSAYAPCSSQYLNAVQVTVEQIDLIRRFVRLYPQHMSFVTSADGWWRFP